MKLNIKKLLIDSILGTLFLLFLLFVILKVSALAIFDVFNPIGEAIGDMEITDVVFSQFREDPTAEERIVLVNIGELGRAGIAEQINILNQYDPAVIGIDSYFYNERDSLGDVLLSQAIQNADSVVLVSKLLYNDSTQTYDSLAISQPNLFNQYAYTGYANLTTEARFQDDFKVNRAFLPKMEVDGHGVEYAFGVKLAQLFDPESAENFLNRKKFEEIINYRGNAIDFYGSNNYANMFPVLDVSDVFSENFVPEMIKGKILIFGYMGKDLTDTSWDDKYYTPMNKIYAGKSNPDMFGAVIHANIVAMILNRDYVNSFTELQAGTIGIILIFLNVMLFSIIYRRLPKWYDGLTKLIQLFEILIILYITIQAFDKFSFKLNLTLGIAGIALAGDGLEVFYGVIMNLFSKEGRKQLFHVYKYEETR